METGLEGCQSTTHNFQGSTLGFGPKGLGSIGHK